MRFAAAFLMVLMLAQSVAATDRKPPRPGYDIVSCKEGKCALPLVIVPPRYPERAWQRRWKGDVIISLEVTEDGKGENCSIIWTSRPRVFDKNLCAAAVKWRFNPKWAGGPYHILYEFRIKRDPNGMNMKHIILKETAT